MDTVIKKDSLSKQVADSLEAMIAEEKYSVGEKIPAETELMEIFSVSRNTVREAVRALASAGILQVRQGDGTYVISASRFSSCMNSRYEQVSPEEICEARNALEITISYLAAKRRTEEDLEKIRDAFIRRKNTGHTDRENTEADINFHMAVAEACHNRIIYDLYTSIFSFIKSHISYRQAETELNTEMMDSLHEELFNAILEQNPDKARISSLNILMM